MAATMTTVLIIAASIKTQCHEKLTTAGLGANAYVEQPSRSRW